MVTLILIGKSKLRSWQEGPFLGTDGHERSCLLNMNNSRPISTIWLPESPLLWSLRTLLCTPFRHFYLPVFKVVSHFTLSLNLPSKQVGIT